MLPKAQRLDTKGVSLVFKNSRKTFQTPFFKVTIAKLKQIKITQCAIVVSKKVAPSAVLRNKLRRRIYSGVSKVNIPPTPPQAVVIQCLKNSAGLSHKDFFAELEKVLQKTIT